MNSLDGQVAIVTGGSSGYGKGIASVLRQRGVRVWITGRDRDRLERAAAQVGAHPFVADATSPNDWERLVETVFDETGRIDVLVNNAGGGVKIAPLDEQSDGEVASSIALNLTSAIIGCKRVAPIMKSAKRGTIINISSVCATQAWPGWSVYSAAKAGMLQFSRCLYTEMRPHGVRVTCVMPSWGATSFNDAAHLPEHEEETFSKKIKPEELGESVAHICAMPRHLAVEQMTIWPLVQEVEPL